MPAEAKNGLMVKYQFEIDDESWNEWKNTVPRSKSLEQRIIELIEADAENRVRPPEENNQTETEAKEDVYNNVGERMETEEEIQTVEDILRGLDLPGSGSKKEKRVKAVLAFYDYLRDHHGERVSRSDLKDHTEDTGLTVGYSSFTSLWNNWVKANESQGRDFNTLAELPGVEMDGDDYVYTGENDE